MIFLAEFIGPRFSGYPDLLDKPLSPANITQQYILNIIVGIKNFAMHSLEMIRLLLFTAALCGIVILTAGSSNDRFDYDTIYPASSNKPPVASSATGALSINRQLGGSLFAAGWQFILNSYVTFKVCENDQLVLNYRGNTNYNTYTLHWTWRVRNSTFRQYNYNICCISDWKAVKGTIPWDLEATPLQIKTDSVLGSDQQILVWMYDKDSSSYISSMTVKFSSTMRYSIDYCRDWTDLPVQPPVEVDKVWTITKAETALIITCNDVEVLNYHFADSSNNKCALKGKNGDWGMLYYYSTYSKGNPQSLEWPASEYLALLENCRHSSRSCAFPINSSVVSSIPETAEASSRTHCSQVFLGLPLDLFSCLWDPVHEDLGDPMFWHPGHMTKPAMETVH
eukprot:sb/3465448/